jgi:hypothetical protein
MTKLKPSLVAFALLCAAATLPAYAESSASSLASDSLSTSVGSLSGSIKKSSASSSGDDKVADGDYKVIEVAEAPAQPGMLRVKLQAVADHSADGEFFLFMPQAAVEQARLAAGHVVAARQRPYGVEFAQGEPRQAFFLVLADEWYRELQTNVVRL